MRWFLAEIYQFLKRGKKKESKKDESKDDDGEEDEEVGIGGLFG